jgi:hypothetical protein
MQLSFGFGPAAPPDAQSARVWKLAAVLAAARHTAFYGPPIARASAGTEEPDLVLSRILPAGVHAYIENREQFRNPKAPSGKGRQQAGVRPRASRDGAIEGSLEELLRLAARIEVGEARPPATARCVIVRTALGERLAPEHARDRLWRVFELPLFEQLLGPQGETLAFECESHDGMHLDAEAAIFEACYGELVVTSLVALRYPAIRMRTGWVGAIDRRGCPCGETVTRFVPVAAVTEAVRKPPATARAARQVQSTVAAVV